MRISLSLGTHEIEAYPIDGTESLRFHFTWYESIVVHDWSCHRLEQLEDTIECEDDYSKAERRFIRAFGYRPKLFDS